MLKSEEQGQTQTIPGEAHTHLELRENSHLPRTIYLPDTVKERRDNSKPLCKSIHIYLSVYVPH